MTIGAVMPLFRTPLTRLGHVSVKAAAPVKFGGALLMPLARWLVLVYAVSMGATHGLAQNYPSKPVRLIVPFSAGSGSDVIARVTAGGLADVMGQQIIVENRTGAAGNIGAELASKAAPDGYTLLFANIGHTANVTLYNNLKYELTRDFAPVTQIGASPAVLVVHPSMPVKSVVELVKLAKMKPGAINYASGGAGTPTFIAAELFKGQAGIDLLHVPYRGGGEALTSVLSGETSVYFAPLANALSLVHQARLRPLAVTSTKRLALLPDQPTVAETGYPGYESGFWHGIMVPAKTSQDVIATIHNATVRTLSNPTTAKRLHDVGYIPIGSPPEEFGSYIRSEIQKLSKVLRGLKVTAE